MTKMTAVATVVEKFFCVSTVETFDILGVVFILERG